MRIIVIDNYDSFVYNLVHILDDLGASDIVVQKNDTVDPDQLHDFDKIVLSPGPGIPQEAGYMPQIIARYAPIKSILGVCLGHQALGEAFGATLHNLQDPLHGVVSTVQITQADYLFEHCPTRFTIGHYHSWVVAAPLPPTLEVLATDSSGNIMALAHQQYDIRGVQFHPESVLTDYGRQLLHNWLWH